MTERAKPPVKKVKLPVPKYHYKLVTVSGSQQAHVMEDALRARLTELRMSYFTIGHEGGKYDVMGDSGSSALSDSDLLGARAVAAKIKKAS